jgi:hypothetical protein
MADDLTGVPTAQWHDFRTQVRHQSAALLLLWAALIILTLTLLRKGIITLPDLAATVGVNRG